jgi:serine/threonine-protein kinase HipA
VSIGGRRRARGHAVLRTAAAAAATESATFTYVSDYIANPRAYSLEPGLPLKAGAHQSHLGQPTFGAFTDCAPDRWGRTLVTRCEAAQARAAGREPRSLGEVDYLLGVRDDLRQGALRFRHVVTDRSRRWGTVGAGT